MMDDQEGEQGINWHMAIAEMNVNGVGILMQEAGERHNIQVCHSISVFSIEVFRLEFISGCGVCDDHGTAHPTTTDIIYSILFHKLLTIYDLVNPQILVKI